jgi:LEA14-like dessication related protein
MSPRVTAVLLLLAAAVAAGSCAYLPGRDPVQVTVAGIEALPSEGMEWRMLVKLRVQNPNDAPLEYNGAYLSLTVLDRSFATGVSDASGTVPRFGEALVEVPVTVPVLRVAANAIRMFNGGGRIERITYRLEGKLNGPMSGATHFASQGELDLPLGATP